MARQLFRLASVTALFLTDGAFFYGPMRPVEIERGPDVDDDQRADVQWTTGQGALSVDRCTRHWLPHWRSMMARTIVILAMYVALVGCVPVGLGLPSGPSLVFLDGTSWAGPFEFEDGLGRGTMTITFSQSGPDGNNLEGTWASAYADANKNNRGTVSGSVYRYVLDLSIEGFPDQRDCKIHLTGTVNASEIEVSLSVFGSQVALGTRPASCSTLRTTRTTLSKL